MDSYVGRGNQYIQMVKVVYCNLSSIGKQLPTPEVGGMFVTTVGRCNNGF